MDVCAAEDADIFPGRTVLVPTGLKFAIPPGYEIQVRPRSGLSLRTALRIPNAPGTVDSGYREELGIIVTNTCLPSGASDIESVLNFEREKGRFPVRGLDGALIEPACEGRRASGGEMPQAATGGETSQVTGGETSQFASGGDASLACVYRVRKGDRIAQLVLKELPVMELVEVASVAGIGEDRNGGFGSTGIGS
jgi:dUTP pyrophosphatase